MSFIDDCPLCTGMRIVDVCAFYSPAGGGVRTYVDAKLRAAPRFGHEVIVIAPGERYEVSRRGPGALMVTLPSPRLPVDRRYRYFDDQRRLHRELDRWCPHHIEASSPWSSATMVGRWQGSASRSLVMHADPLAAYAYRWLGGMAAHATIDRWFSRFWKHLRGLGNLFDLVVCANTQLRDRLHEGGIANGETIAMGVEAGLFSPRLRCDRLRGQALAALGLDQSALLLVGVGRFAAEKRWEMVMRAVDDCASGQPIGLLLIGDGSRRQRLEILGQRLRSTIVAPRVGERAELARLLASADALVHGCEAETFCMVAAEARASGIPLIVPDRGAAADQLVRRAGLTYRAGSEHALKQALRQFVTRGPELQRAVAARTGPTRTMDDHFAQLFRRYQGLATNLRAQSEAEVQVRVAAR